MLAQVLGLLGADYLQRAFRRREDRKRNERNTNRFLNSIDNGQKANADPNDMAIMKTPQELATMATGMQPEQPQQFQNALPQPNGQNNTDNSKSKLGMLGQLAGFDNNFLKLMGYDTQENPLLKLATTGAFDLLKGNESASTTDSTQATPIAGAQAIPYESYSAAVPSNIQAPNYQANNFYNGYNLNTDFAKNVNKWLKPNPYFRK